jgi:hypothetical protein
MQHKSLDEIRPVAQVIPAEAGKMSRREKLERWATVLESYEGRVRPLLRIEYMPEQERVLLRGDETPLSVAFGDPVLREQGLASDRFGDAKTFFELTDQEAHHLLCDCHYHGTMTAAGVAARARSIANRVSFREIWDRTREAAASWW